MHKNLNVTNGVYGVLSDLNVREQIANLGKWADDKDDLLNSLRELLNAMLSCYVYI